MIVKCSFGRVPLEAWGWDVIKASPQDIMEFVGTYGQALFDAADKREPDFSEVKPELVARLARQGTSVEIPDCPDPADTLRLADALYEVNALDLMGKLLRRWQQLRQLAANSQS